MATVPEALHIHELRGDNFKRLKHFAVKLPPGVTQVTGKNGAGKSTFLDVVRHLLGDASQHSAEVIRRGEESCQLMGDLGDFVVERRWRKTEKGELQTVVLKAKDGTRLQSPQAILDSFYNTYTFDPLAFMRLEPKKQLEELKALVGVNTGPIEGKRQDLYEQRTEINRKRTDRGARLKATPAPTVDLPEKPVDVDELLQKQNELQSVVLRNESKRRDLRDAVKECAGMMKSCEAADIRVRMAVDTLEQAKRQLEKAEADAASLKGAAEAARLDLEERRKQVDELVDPDVGDLSAKISAAQATNIALARAADRKKLELELKALDDEEAQLTAAIAQLDKEKAELIAKAKFPVEGIGLGADGPMFRGFPLAQASSAERMRVSTAMGFAGNPRLKLLAIHDGSLLDDESMALLEKLCAEAGGQLLVERVGVGSDVGILIEDGEVVSARAVKGGGQQDLGIVLEGRQP
jgi:energy-coupling factor transporter ATP-binding protein EcfA2